MHKDTAGTKAALLSHFSHSTVSARPFIERAAEKETHNMQMTGNTILIKEICVKRVYPLRFAAQQGQAKYEEQFRSFNESVASAASA